MDSTSRRPAGSTVRGPSTSSPPAGSPSRYWPERRVCRGWGPRCPGMEATDGDPPSRASSPGIRGEILPAMARAGACPAGMDSLVLARLLLVLPGFLLDHPAELALVGLDAGDAELHALGHQDGH